MTDRGYRISNVDVTLICERPKVNVEHNGRKVALTLNLPLPLPLTLTLTLTPTPNPKPTPTPDANQVRLSPIFSGGGQERGIATSKP